jgi:hypothetical protein
MKAGKGSDGSGGRGNKRNPVEIVTQGLESGKTRDIIGKAVGVSGPLIDRAAKVIDDGVPELAKAVDEGRLSVSAAAKLTEADEETQRTVASEAKFQGGRYRKQKPETNGTPARPQESRQRNRPSARSH